VRTPADLDSAFEAALRERADALQAFSDPLSVSQRGAFEAAAQFLRVPAAARSRIS
jgi:hypothetical protein